MNYSAVSLPRTTGISTNRSTLHREGRPTVNARPCTLYHIDLRFLRRQDWSTPAMPPRHYTHRHTFVIVFLGLPSPYAAPPVATPPIAAAPFAAPPRGFAPLYPPRTGTCRNIIPQQQESLTAIIWRSWCTRRETSWIVSRCERGSRRFSEN